MPLSLHRSHLSSHALAVAPLCLHRVMVSLQLSCRCQFATIVYPITVKPSREPQDLKRQHSNPQSSDNTSLSTAIESASHAQLCLILRQLCSYSRTATDIASKHLIPTKPIEEKKKQVSPEQTFPRSILKKTSSFGRSSQPTQTSSPTEVAPSLTKRSPSPKKHHQDDPPSSNNNNKRKPQTQCRNCGSEYSASATSVTEPCVHHPGNAVSLSPHHDHHDQGLLLSLPRIVPKRTRAPY